MIGAGSGGLAAAKRAAKHGARVAIVEGDRVGGTCVIRGCVPKKLLLYGSLYKEHIANASGFGVDLSEAKIDSGQLLKNVRTEVDRLNSLHIQFLEKSGVQLFNGWASFIDSHSILIKNDNEKNLKISGERILIAIGGEPNRPDIPGGELGWVSDDIFLLEQFPSDIIIVGAGFIACEFACILNGLGVQVTQLVRGTKLLRGFDHDLSLTLQEEMENSGIKLHFGQFPISITGKPGNFKVKSNIEGVYECAGLLYAIGRTPKIVNINLSAAGVITEKNRILTDEYQRTNIENIYAVGDVNNRFNLTPVAIKEGRVFSDRIYGKKNIPVNYNFVPSAVFSHPEIATVGLTEERAKELHGETNIKIHIVKFRSMSQALPKRGPSCMLKLVLHSNSDTILGCHMVGEHASEIIQMASIALVMGATKSDFDNTMALHPTVAEEFVTMV